jgi:hypothetical protein
MSRRTIHLIVAPDIPACECIALEKHVKEALVDPDYTVVVNYEVRWDILTIEDGDRLIVTVTDEVTSDNVEALREKLNDPNTYVAAVNYEVSTTIVNKKKPRDVQLVVAPMIPLSELLRLKEDADDPDRILVVNYEMGLDFIPTEETE